MYDAVMFVIAMATGAGILGMGYLMGRLDRRTSRAEEMLAGLSPDPDAENKRKDDPKPKPYDNW